MSSYHQCEQIGRQDNFLKEARPRSLNVSKCWMVQMKVEGHQCTRALRNDNRNLSCVMHRVLVVQSFGDLVLTSSFGCVLSRENGKRVTTCLGVTNQVGQRPTTAASWSNVQEWNGTHNVG